MRDTVRKGPVPQRTLTLMMLRGAHIVGSTYHAIMLTQALRKEGETEQHITAVATWQDAPTSPTPNGSHWSWWRPSVNASPTNGSPGPPRSTATRRPGCSP
ncbi:carboxymuconolactone decarboxylase family protein [Actinomadura litoris]|uniref:carboxymuconolactone decarboxylase family protein n=1 Tax=Actinomadura litoris TaxID=2678616 RepID=UPI0035E43FF6